MKRIFAAMLSICLITATAASPAGMSRAAAAGITEEELIKTGNVDLYDEDGNALQDDTYQYSVSSDTYYAFLWVPEQAEHLNGVMVAKSNLIEPRVLESVTVRNVLAKYHIGVVYLHARSTTDKPNQGNDMGSFDYTAGHNAGSVLDEMLARLATVSGYDELLYAPLIGIGHSAGMGLGHAVGSWDPGRAIAQIGMKCGLGIGIPGSQVSDSYETQPGVPTYLATGQFTEHGDYNNPSAKDDYIDREIPNISKVRAKGVNRLLTVSVEWETGHYDWSEQSNEAVANYLDHIIPARLGAQATSQEKIPRDYSLVDLTNSEEAYVAEPAMLGTRSVINKEGTYKHGLAKNFSEDEQKKMIWFVDQAQYEFVRDFTQERKNAEVVNDTPSGEEDDRVTLIPTSYDRSYQKADGAFSCWPAGNICFYISDTNEIAYEFDISALKTELESLDKVTLVIPWKANNTSRKAILYQVDNPWDAERNFTVPAERTQIADNLAVDAIQVDITEQVRNAEQDHLYFVLGSNDGGSGTDYYATTAYDGYTNGSLTDDRNLIAHLTVDYKKAQDEKPAVLYSKSDICYDHADGKKGGWNGSSHYINDDTNIVVGFDTSALMANADQITKVVFAMTRSNTAPACETTVSRLSGDPFAGAYQPDIISGGEDIGTVDGNTFQDFDVTEYATSGESLYLNLRYTENNGSAGNDYYSEQGSGFNTEASDDAQRPRLIVTYSDGEADEPELTDKHQYLRMEDPGKGVPKELSRISRYDVINPGDTGFQNGIEGDPNTFSMVVDKMNQVTCDHHGTGTDVAVSDTPAYVVPAMAPWEWIGVKEEPLNGTDASNHVASKWRNYMRWKNNRVYYHMTSQDSYVNVNTYDVYGDDGTLQFARGTQTFQIYGATNQTGAPQTIQFDDVPDYTVSQLQSGVTVRPVSSRAADGYQVDLMVDYGPIRAERQPDGSYQLKLNQLPAGADYPIECKLVATQFGSSLNKVRMAEPVEKVFYLYNDEQELAPITKSGTIDTDLWKMKGVTGLQVEGEGTVTLGMDTNTRFNAEFCAQISAERKNSDDPNYQKHYQYPDGYDPHDYWADYPGTWTAEANHDTISLGDFTSKGRTNIDLTYINTIQLGEGITKVTPVVAQEEVVGAKANTWGRGVNVVWQQPHGKAWDTVAVYNGGQKLAETESPDQTNVVVTGLEKGHYELTVKTILDGTESEGVRIQADVDGRDYLIDDFEGGDLTAGLDWVSYAKVQNAYSFSSYMGESLLLSNDEEDNHYLAMQCTYTPYIQTVNVSIPGGLTPEMSKLVMDIKVDKLEDSQSNGQVYFELYNPTTGVSYAIDRGDEFPLADKGWHKGYTLSLSDFKLPADAETLAQITVLKIGRRPVGGGNNNRRGKMYLDNISLSEVPDYTLRSFSVEKLDEDEADGKATLVVNWAKPAGGADSYQITVKRDESEVKKETLAADATSYTLADLAMGATYSVTLEVIVDGETVESKTRSVGFFVPDKEVTYTVAKDTSYSNANAIQGAADGCIMIGRGRIAMLQFDLEDEGNVAKAQLQMTSIRGTKVPIAAFLMPNNDWIEDSADFVPSKYKPIADSDKTLSNYTPFDAQSIFPDLVRGEDNDIVPPAAEDQLAVVQSAASGSMKDFYYGDCVAADNALTIDVTQAVAEAQRMGNTAVTLLLITPYKVAATLDIWGRDTVWNGQAVTEEQQPKLTVSYARNDVPQVEYTLGDVDNDGAINLSDALLALKISVDSGYDKQSQPYLAAEVDGDGNVTSKDVLMILQKANGKDVPELRG